jgi:hypothetical protein
MNRHHTLAYLAFVAASAISTTSAAAQFPTEEIPKAEPEYIAKVRTAAPASIVNNAAIIIMDQAGGAAKTLQTGSNGFTCFIGGDGTPECDDQNAMEWRKALRANQTPPNKIGFIYMLAGDTGTSNHDGSQRHTHEHWVQTGAARDDRRWGCAGDAEPLSARCRCERSDAALCHVPRQAQRAPDDPSTRHADGDPVSAHFAAVPVDRRHGGAFGSVPL